MQPAPIHAGAERACLPAPQALKPRASNVNPQPQASAPPANSTKTMNAAASPSASSSKPNPSPKPSANPRAREPTRPDTRSLKQPLTLRVAESPSPLARPAVSGAGDAAELRAALKRRTKMARKGEKWIDRAMEEVLGREEFMKALSYMHQAQYQEVTHERHLNHLCSYPLCPNPPAAEYRSAKRFVVSTRARTITEREGNDEEGFCGKKCMARSAWVASRLGREAAWLKGQGSGFELLEDLEARGEARWTGRRGDVLEWVKKDANGAMGDKPTAAGVEEVSEKQDKTASPAKVSPQPTAPAEALSALPKDAPISDLLASLSIVERATPSKMPIPPSLDGAPPAEQGKPIAISSAAPAAAQNERVSAPSLPLPLPLPQPQPQAQAQANDSQTPRSSRRAAGALVPSSTSKLGGLVMSASKKLAPDESDEESAEEEDWARAMGWGEGPELDALFAEARRARELMGGEEPSGVPAAQTAEGAGGEEADAGEEEGGEDEADLAAGVEAMVLAKEQAEDKGGPIDAPAADRA